MTDFVRRIEAAYAAEAADRRRPMTRADIPFAFEDVGPEWMTAVLCQGRPAAQVKAVGLGPADDGTSNRRRLFVEYLDPAAASGLPASLFCKATQGLANRLLIGPLGAIEGEVNFYNQIKPLLPDLETPTCRFAACNEALNSIIVLDDLGADVVFCTHTTEISRERIERQLQLLAGLHGRGLRSAELRRRAMVYPTWGEQFSRLEPFFREPCDAGFAASEQVIPPRLFARRAEIWAATRRSVDRHQALPWTLAHGDVHLRNWYLRPDGVMGLADWQGLSRGHWSRDLIYVIVTSLQVEQRRAWCADLLRYYHERLAEAAGCDLSFDEVEREVRAQLLSVLAFWTMTMVVQPGMTELVQPADATLEFVRRIAVAIDDLDALDAFDAAG